MDGSGRSAARAAGATCLLVSVACLVGGCGGTDFAGRASPPRSEAQFAPAPLPPPTVRNPVLQSELVRAVARTTGARTARSSVSVTLTGLGDGSVTSGAYDVAGTGVVDLRSGNAALVLSVPRFDRAGGSGTAEERIVGGIAYIAPPAPVFAAGGLTGAVHWLSLETRRVGGSDPSALAQAEVDPAGPLAWLSAVSANVRRIGAEPVRGVSTEHYGATIDVPLPVARATSAPLRKLASLAVVVGPARLDVDAWLDGGGRIRRVVVSIPLSASAGTLRDDVVAARAMMRIQVDLYGFGAPVQLAVPPQSEVRPYSSLHIPSPTG